MAITVELARPADNAFVHLLHDEAFGDMTIADYMQWITERGRRVYVVKQGDKRVGFVMIRLGRESVTVCKIAINQHYRRHGIATEAVKQIAAKHGKRLIRAVIEGDPTVEPQDFLRSLGMRLKLVEGEPKDRYWVFEGQNKESAKR